MASAALSIERLAVSTQGLASAVERAASARRRPGTLSFITQWQSVRELENELRKVVDLWDTSGHVFPPSDDAAMRQIGIRLLEGAKRLEQALANSRARLFDRKIARRINAAVLTIENIAEAVLMTATPEVRNELAARIEEVRTTPADDTDDWRRALSEL